MILILRLGLFLYEVLSGDLGHLPIILHFLVGQCFFHTFSITTPGGRRFLCSQPYLVCHFFGYCDKNVTPVGIPFIVFIFFLNTNELSFSTVFPVPLIRNDCFSSIKNKFSLL